MNPMQKYLTIVMLIFSMASFVAAATARVTDEKLQQENDASDSAITSGNAGTLFLSLYAGPGGTYPSGNITGTGDQRRIVELGYSGGMTVGYLVFDSGGFFAGTEYLHERFAIKRKWMMYPMSNKLYLTFINTYVGYKFLFLKYAYADVGLYYSAKITSWNERVSIMGCSMTHEIPKKLRHDVGGLVIGAGAAIPVTGYLNVDVGVRFLVSFVPALKYMDTIIPNMGQVTAGLTFKVPLNPSKKG